MFTANFCKKKFRTLRERFTRELRKSYLEPNLQVKYEYFKELQFLTPYIKFRSISFESSDGKTIVTKRDDGMVDKDHSVEELKMIEQESYFTEEQEPTEQFLTEAGGSQNIIYESVHVPEFSSGPSHQLHEVVQQSDEENLSSTNKPSERKRQTSWDDVDDQDDNKYFAMSVYCSLKRLSTINNLRAKKKIFQVLEKYCEADLEKK